MKILFIHPYHLDRGAAGASRSRALARLWTEAGHEVTVIAGTADPAAGTAPGRRRWRWLSREQDGLVRVWRCRGPHATGGSALGRAWAFVRFTLSALAAALVVPRADVVIASSPPLVVALPGWLAARRMRAPLVFEVRELHPECAVTTGALSPRSIRTRLLYALEAWAYRAADRVNVLTPAFREDLLRRDVVDDQKVVCIPSGADLELFRPGPRDNPVRREMGWGDRLVVLYAGAHDGASGLGQLVDAAEALRDVPDVLIATVGDGPERARHERDARARGLRNIVFCGPQSRERVPDFVNACDVGAAVLKDNPTFRTVYPDEIFDYMACARPTLVAVDGIARKLVCDEAHAGVFAEPENGASLAEAILRLASDPAGLAEMGRHGRKWVEAHASRAALAARYLDVLRKLAGAPLGVELEAGK